MLDRLPAWSVEALATVPHDELPALGEDLAEREGWFADEACQAGCAWLVRELR